MTDDDDAAAAVVDPRVAPDPVVTAEDRVVPGPAVVDRPVGTGPVTTATAGRGTRRKEPS
ncbi:hypothetical protein [Georgenia sp. SUBG003]|uniref:hypothetical protein n=1 Tax=Georgenia sp. SUBG003 TaxID=1497974 RepID=UPI0004D46D26|nr:hypothetical protein DA06_10570 [Georgenia sp. SUBG003]